MTYNPEPRTIAYTEHETRPIPTAHQRRGKVVVFMTWNDDWQSTQGQTNANNFCTGEYHNPQANKEKVYTRVCHHP
ncbi:MAG: hypothetical protein LBK00_02875 [Treponema sp.]|nr:hypothetical protein [Treponema sp.]